MRGCMGGSLQGYAPHPVLCAAGKTYVASSRLVVLGAPLPAALHSIVLQLMHALGKQRHAGQHKMQRCCWLLLRALCRVCLGIHAKVGQVLYLSDKLQAWAVRERSLRHAGRALCHLGAALRGCSTLGVTAARVAQRSCVYCALTWAPQCMTRFSREWAFGCSRWRGRR